jgi:hypothetical protein
MTTARSYGIELTDVQRVSFECKTCHSVFSMPTDGWKPPARCPRGCDGEWANDHTVVGQSLHGLALHMQRLREHDKENLFSLRFDIAPPDAQS